MAVVLGVLLFPAGCQKLLEEDQFYEYSVPQEKLQTIEPLDLSEVKQHDPNEDRTVIELAEEQLGPVREYSVGIEKCRALTLQNNLDLQVSLIDPTIAAERLSAEEAKFESTFYTNAFYTRSDQPQQSFVELVPNSGIFSPTISGSRSDRYSENLGVQMPLQTGGNVTFNLADSRSKRLTKDAPSSPWYTDDFSISLTQPLLRNAGTRINRHSIRLYRYNKQITDNATKLEVIRILAAADAAYWDLYAARRELEVRQQQLELARKQLSRAKRFVAEGELAEVEVLRAEAGVSTQLAAIITAENSLRRRQREFKLITNKPGTPVDSTTVPVPTTEPDPVHYDFSIEDVIRQAMVNRGELLALELQIAIDAINIDSLNNQMLPQLDLRYNYGVNGVGSTFDDSHEMLSDKNFESHTVGVNLSIPLGNNANKSLLRRALYQRRKDLADREKLREQIKQDVLNALDAVETSWQQILASRQSAILQGRLYQAEINQFEAGVRTSTDVLEAQTNFANAQSAEINAVVNYEKSLVDLADATGTLLGAAKVDWAPIVPEIGVR